ncbi:MAG: hypothetical protein IKP61_03670 [Spirochaetales bacterium]|nr:hypothetical protein [Spirochaetales bacterium]
MAPPTRVGEQNGYTQRNTQNRGFRFSRIQKTCPRRKAPCRDVRQGWNVHIILDAHDFDLQLRKLAIGKECEVVVEGKTYKCIFKALQENIMYGTLVHADFQIV